MIFALAFGIVEEPTRKFHPASGPEKSFELENVLPSENISLFARFRDARVLTFANFQARASHDPARQVVMHAPKNILLRRTISLDSLRSAA